jgi:hypothetical protein
MEEYTQTNMPKISLFLSFATADKEVIPDKLYAKLDEDFTVWYFPVVVEEGFTRFFELLTDIKNGRPITMGLYNAEDYLVR